MTTRPRPTSPHLQIYKFTITMTTSIVHRITGVGLYGGMLLLVAWLGAAALGEQPLSVVNAIFGSWFGQLILFCFTWALFQHLLGGIRHFIWDSGRGFEPGVRENIAWANVIGAIILTLLAWAIFVWF
jgi:succinate dehydrogenase / fumarate reductase cytochrome b subunit